MPPQDSMQNLKDTVDDIISSGYGWSEWHEEQLTELFEDTNEARRKKFIKAYYNDSEYPAEGATYEEIQFMSNMLDLPITIKFTPQN